MLAVVPAASRGMELAMERRGDPPRKEDDLPFPDSLCHSCAAPPKYIRTERSTFLFCPIFRKYPPQPVRECPEFRPREDSES